MDVSNHLVEDLNLVYYLDTESGEGGTVPAERLCPETVSTSLAVSAHYRYTLSSIGVCTPIAPYCGVRIHAVERQQRGLLY